MTYSTTIKYTGNNKTIEAQSFLPKKELSKIFGTGVIKLQISRTRNHWHKPKSDHDHAYIIRSRNKTKSKKINLWE